LFSETKLLRPSGLRLLLALIVAMAMAGILAVPAWAAPSLAINKQGPATVTKGASFSYMLTVSNPGDATTTGVMVTDQLPSGVTLRAPLPSGCTATSGASGQITVSCNVGDLGMNQLVPLRLNVTAPKTLGTISNQGTATSTNVPAITSNTVTTTVKAKKKKHHRHHRHHRR
jgi:uncharacterized repeat protein (TIGR01451 family)